MKINSTVTNNQKMCPPGSSKNCYDLVSRRVTCEFSFAINGFTSGYSCPASQVRDQLPRAIERSASVERGPTRGLLHRKVSNAGWCSSPSRRLQEEMSREGLKERSLASHDR
jgi:hypothetical protein